MEPIFGPTGPEGPTLTAPLTTTHCLGTTRSGNPCKAIFDLSPAGFCLMHDPLRVNTPQMKRARAGLDKTRKKGSQFVSPEDLPCDGKLETLEDCAKWAAWIAVQTLTGQIDEGKAREATKAVNMLRLQLKDERAADKRLKELQRRLAEVKAPQ